MQAYLDPSAPLTERVRDLLSRMTIEEKIGQMCQLPGDRTPDIEEWIGERGIGSVLHVTGERTEQLQKSASGTRLGIPLLFGIDAIHGHAFRDGATVFPSPLSLSCSWNPRLLEEVARITAREVAADGLHWTFSPVLCLARDARWGRVGETFGEDPYLAGVLGSAMIRGYQGRDLADGEAILACAKHYVGYGETQGGRDSAEADLSHRKLRSVFLPPFQAAAEAGCATFMTAYHAIDGVPCSADPWLLRDVLKGEWGFTGLVVTDWNNVERMHTEQNIFSGIEEAAAAAVNAGNDMIMATPAFYEAAREAFRNGRIPEATIDRAVERILLAKFRFGLFDQRPGTSRPSGEVIGSADHRSRAYEAALQSMVLLKNEGQLLPLPKKAMKIAVVGPNADDVISQLGDWSFGPDVEGKRANVRKGMHEKFAVSILDGIRSRTGEDQRVIHARGCDVIDRDGKRIREAVDAAEKADVVVAVVGDTIDLNGERQDRASLDLTGGQRQLLEELLSTGKPLVVVLVSGKPLSVEWIREHADALLAAFNPGLEGGNAVADILFGNQVPSGKLTVSFPAHTGQQPVYYNQLPGWHASTYADMSAEPLYPFGYGLSYTDFAYSGLTLSAREASRDQVISVSVTVENTGGRDGTEIVQLYVHDRYSSVTVPVKELKGFVRVFLKRGEKKTVELKLPVESLSLVDREEHRIVEPGEFEIMVGSSSRDEDLLRETLTVS